MNKKGLINIIASNNVSVKEIMRMIDHSGLRVAYVTGQNGKLLGAVSDSEVRRAILKGKDINSSVEDIINADPVVISEQEIVNSSQAKKIVRRLLERMPDSRFILIVDGQNRPKKLLSCAEILGQKAICPRGILTRGKKILVVGGAGYLGSVLTRKLLVQGFKVKVMDILMFGREPIADLIGKPNFELVEEDMRNISALVRALAGVDAVINLAAVVGDPACKSKPEMAIETNYLANKSLAEACKYHQINRFIYASTCSVYGQMQGAEELTEDAALNPVSLYARSKIQSEEGILSLMDDNFSPTIMRMSTLYGFSPRMRFDLVVNTMTKTAVVDRKIQVHGGGKQWRPLLHTEDAAAAYLKCLSAPLSAVRGETFNVGSSRQNFQIIQIAKAVNKCVPNAKLIIDGESSDPRNYMVSFAKIENLLGFNIMKRLEASIIKIKKAIESGEIKNVNDPKYYNMEYNQ